MSSFPFSRDPESDLPTDKLDRAMALRNGLVALCERMPSIGC
jgi:hypothetical protein